MARKPAAQPGRIVLEGFDQQEDRPALTIRAFDDEGNVIATVPVEADGSVRATKELSRATKAVVGPADADSAARRASYTIPGSELKRLLLENAELRIPQVFWNDWFPRFRCVSGEVRRCFPFLDVLDNVILDAQLQDTWKIRQVVGTRPLVPFPTACSPICFGTVEVYRRVCCCRPIFDGPFQIDIDDILARPRFPKFPEPPEDVVGPVNPGPGPDPAPEELRTLLFTGDALDAHKVQALRASSDLPTLSVAEAREYVSLRPLLWCRCGTPQKVAEGQVQDGRFSACWRVWGERLAKGCSEKFAYVVKQPIGPGGSLVTIYNGVAANQWFDADDYPTLTSYSLRAVGCRETDVPGEGPFVVLEHIGTTDAYHLGTPAQDSFQSVATPVYNSGLLNPVANPADAVGQPYNRNLGGNVALLYHFTESMIGVGAVYYRVRVAAADANGDPAGSWTPVTVPVWRKWRADGTVADVPLGPNTVGAEANLFRIPFDTPGGGRPLAVNEEWQDLQYHAVIPTASFPNGRYLVMIEVFDAGGQRLKPNSAPAGEAGTARGFTFRRWNVPASSVAVPFAALTHLLWWDNRPAEASIDDLRLNGASSSADCQFLEGNANATVEVGYRAYHPQPGTPSFLHYHSLVLTRGLAGTNWQVANLPGLEVGEPPAGLQTSVPKTLGDLLGDRPAGDQKCAFAISLAAHVKTTNGSGTLHNLDRYRTGAFAAEIV